MQTVSISFFRFATLRAKLWAFSQMLFARAPLAAMPGIGFVKLFGTGTGEGFTPKPNWSVYAILATWPSPEAAREAVATGAVFRRYRAHAAESATVYLEPASARGEWDGRAPFEAPKTPARLAPVAVLTRATLKKRHVLAFWRWTPDVSALVRDQAALRFRIGMGEVPWFQQVTFSIWSDPAAMVAFAYGKGAHQGAIRDVHRHGWFKEELYARFAVLAMEGRWEGREPLAGVSLPSRPVAAREAVA